MPDLCHSCRSVQILFGFGLLYMILRKLQDWQCRTFATPADPFRSEQDLKHIKILTMSTVLLTPGITRTMYVYDLVAIENCNKFYTSFYTSEFPDQKYGYFYEIEFDKPWKTKELVSKCMFSFTYKGVELHLDEEYLPSDAVDIMNAGIVWNKLGLAIMARPRYFQKRFGEARLENNITELGAYYWDIEPLRDEDATDNIFLGMPVFDFFTDQPLESEQDKETRARIKSELSRKTKADIAKRWGL